MSAYRIADGARVWSARSGADNYFGYLALSGDILIFFSDKNSSIYARSLSNGGEPRVLELHESFVMSTDAAGLAPAVPSGDPVFAKPYLLISKLGTLAVYRVE